MFLQLIQKVCKVTKIKECMNEECLRRKRKMRSAPSTEWNHFRDWALTMISCQFYASDQGLKDESRGYGNIVHTLWMVARYTRHEKMRPDIDLFQVCELINWMFTVAYYLHPRFKKTAYSPLRTHITEREVAEATKTAQKMGVCSNRLWNLAVSGGGSQEVDLPILMRMLDDNAHDSMKDIRRRAHQDRDGSLQLVNTCLNYKPEYPFDISQLQLESDHVDCNPEVCCFSNIDSTRVKQLHKCSTKDCGEPFKFPFSEFEQPYPRFVWWLENSEDTAKVVDVKSPYMAISHVWSDGTGGGVQGGGRVNRCLFNYFKGIAEKLGCTAIWWDTISIPVELAARQNAISRMHENFQDAAQVIIHDQGLVRLPWIDDGSCCLAILLSTWFTRAWTTLELIMSKKAKISVIFRDPSDHNQYVIKNLDEDILACHPAYSSRGHWIASSIIHQLRQQQFNNIADIQRTLKTKNTSWPRDFMVISGLLMGCKPEISRPGFIARTTRDVIRQFTDIEESFLYHGHATMTEEGPFSWCPFSLQDVHIQSDADPVERVFVDEHGAAIGTWAYRELSEKEAKENIHPYNFHISVEYRIRAALAQWEKCLLLKNESRKDRQVILVRPIDVGECSICGVTYVVLDCLYIGTVQVSLEWGPLYLGSVRLGKVTGNSDINAQEAIDRYDDTKGPRIWGTPWRHHMDSKRPVRK